MITSTEELKLEDTSLEPKEKDTPQPITHMVPTLVDYTNLQKLKIEGFLEQQSVIILIDIGSIHNFMSSKVILGSSATTTTTQHLDEVPKEESSGFSIQIQVFYEIEDKKTLPQLAEFLGVSTQPSRLPPLKLVYPPMLNRSKLLPVVVRLDYFIQPQKVKDKRVVHEITETRIIRPCLFPAMTRPYILFPEDKLLLKYYILLNSPWLLMQHFQISGDFHDFPQDRTMMLKEFLDDDI
ncbi:hypothetical protein B296_00005014 [Ensete ventricosum]|uniref:Uncharacterized protein n=1 Tax=Ensete ventricosum TaxID=4639 RepID=A0A426Z2J7_ENSVE|nr:hypothetical protein B296_00005014 [Ensete ventricosum]